jgi:hypothetical protein
VRAGRGRRVDQAIAKRVAAVAPRQYFILAERCGGRWGIEFGDYDRETVASEYQDRRDHDVKARDLKIIRTLDDQSAIDAAVASLNLDEPAPAL